ncbi:MAG: leucyl aminopeptidase family protein [Alphaproteobacteria bacterium]|nr:leucyl aminopeptidase family protein [Alphaproteobacteria bacterium]
MLVTHTNDTVTPLVTRTKNHRTTAFERSMLSHFGQDDIVFITDAKGVLQKVSLPEKEWSYYGCLPGKLKKGVYQFAQGQEDGQKALAFALGGYGFSRHKFGKAKVKPSLLVSQETYDAIQPIVDAIYLVRNLINEPANYMGPAELEDVAKAIADKHKGKFTSIVGDALEGEYPLVHMVGKGAEEARAPRFVMLSFTHSKASKTIALVGKGVCFDTGGLNVKPDSGMLLMKKDMGGAAQILGLTQLLLAKKVPVNLNVYLPLVENAVDARAMRPLDIVTARSGATVEVGHTDAEGRLILADALTRACEDKPDLIIDCATLTGAARVALGPELPAFFTNTPWVASSLYACSESVDDPLWQLPLYYPYKESLNSTIADIKNVASHGYGGAIIAALFMEHFMTPGIPWLHMDFMGWNVRSRPSFPEGGDAIGLRALFALISDFSEERG